MRTAALALAAVVVAIAVSAVAFAGGASVETLGLAVLVGVQIAVVPAGLSAEAQHVIDSLEAHLGAVVKAAQNGAPGLLSAVHGFADDAMAAIAAFGGRLARDGEALAAHLGRGDATDAGTKPTSGASA